MKPKPKLAADRERLNSIADRLRAGERYEDVVRDLDGVLGTEMPERCEAAETAYEACRTAGESPKRP